MLEKFRSRVFSRSAANILISAIVVTFFAGIILAYHYMLYNEKRDRIIFDGQMAAMRTADHLEEYFSQTADVIQLTAYTLKTMLAEQRTKREIQVYLKEQYTAVSQSLINNSREIYSYIKGEYIDGSGWVPYTGFDATARPWYTKAMENEGGITIVEPYVDVHTGKFIMTVAKELGDGESVLGMNLGLDRVQEIAEEAVVSGNADIELIIDSRNVIVAHSDPNEIGKNYDEETGTFGALLLEKVNHAAGDSFEMDYAGENYIVHVAKVRNGWYCLSVKNATNVFQPLEILLWITITVVIAVILILSYIMTKFYQQYTEARQLNKRLTSLANIYLAMYEVDVAADRFNVIRPPRAFFFRHAGNPKQKASSTMESMARELADDVSLEDLLRFVALDTLTERLKNVGLLSMEFFTVTHRWIRLRFIVSQKDSDGNPARILLLAEDIDRERKERDALIHVSERVVATSEAKSVFLSNISHEIRTPINAMLGMNEMILRECGEKNILDYAEKIKNAGRTLLELVNNILDFSRIESGKIELAPVEYDLSKVIRELIGSIRLQAAAKGLAVSHEFDKDTPRRLFGDEARIKQVVANILINAVKYTERGSLIFSVGFQRIEDEPDSILLHIAVKDSGIGIKPEDMDKLFQKFERLEENRNRNIEGVGLGLPITQNLLYMMGTSLQVESIYGLGSKFYFLLKQKVVRWEPLGEDWHP